MSERTQAEQAEHEAHEQRLAAALRDLLHEADLGDYRNGRGAPLGDNRAYQRAQALVEEFDVTHELLCSSLDECDPAGDLAGAARRILEAREAKPTDTPAEYETWRTGP